MNEEIQKALIDLEASLNELDEAAKIIKESEEASGELIHSVSATINKVRDQLAKYCAKRTLVLAQSGHQFLTKADKDSC
jgi:hypothetical protein